MTAVVQVEDISKKFCRGLKRGMMYTAADVGRDLMGRRANVETLRPEEFWAVRDVAFQLEPGVSLGLLGLNGAGKSTLLKMLNGIIRPDKGRIRMRGRVGALIEVGAGFHPMLSGRENIYINGAILGMNKQEIDRKFDAIVDFSELDPRVLEAPVKTYSSGMYVRLGFAVAIHCEPDILLIDEVLSVGDLKFTGKCRKRLQEMRKQGVTFLLVSHHLPTVEAVCDQAILMEQGQIVEFGPTRRATTRLRLSLGGQNNLASTATPSSQKIRAGGPSAALTSVALLDEWGKENHAPDMQVSCGTRQSIRIGIATPEKLEKALLMVWMARAVDDLVACCGHIRIPDDIPALNSGSITLSLPFTPYPGEYRLGVTLAENGPLDIIDEAYSAPFFITPGKIMPSVESGDASVGVCAVPLQLVS